jgi:hypothetical protein
MRESRRPPLAEIDTWTLWLAIRAGRWGQARPWLLLLAGFCAVLAGLAAFFWLTARTDPVAVVGLLIGLIWFSFYLQQRLSRQPGFALATVAALLTVAGLVFGLWLLVYWLSGENVWIGMLGVMLVCGLGIILGVAGINRLEPRA